ncbi:hypothetical protein ACQP06_05550 [Nocardia sp. CA-136227]|uniref:hypothetical protein n=1 Tax=Nocardia sp. CA-136227 TaxID=3239979 RepID=UPI003D965D79
MKHRKPSRIKASTSLTLAGAAAVVSLLSAPANAAPADPGAVPADQQQPDGTQPPADTPTPDPKAQSVPAPKPEKPQPGTTKPQQSQPGVTTPTTPNNTAPDNGADKPDSGQPQGATQPDATNTPKPDATAPKPDANAPKPDANAPKNDQGAQPAGVNPGQPKSVRPSQPGVTVPRVAPLPVPGQSTPAQPAVVTPQQDAATPPSTQPGTTVPAQPGTQPVKPNDRSADPAVTTPAQNPDADTMTGPQTVTPQAKPQWQSPAVDAAPAAPVVAMSGPHSELGVNLDGGAVLPGWAANTHHFSNLDGYVGTIGYTTPGGLGEAGMSLDFTTVNQIKVTAFAGSGPDNDQKVEFVLDTAAANAAKANAENFIRLLPGGATVLEAAAQIGRLPEGERPSQSIDIGGVTAQTGGSVQY